MSEDGAFISIKSLAETWRRAEMIVEAMLERARLCQALMIVDAVFHP